MPRQQLSDEAAAYVRELVVSGQLRSGAYVRVGRIAEELGISATPVREGLLALRGEGFLQLQPRRGFVVAPLQEDDIRDLFWVQAEIAGELASRAAKLLSDDAILTLEGHQAQLVAALDRNDIAEVKRRNHEFHKMINVSAQSPKLTWFLGVAARYAPHRFYHRIFGWPDASVRDHVDIIDALRRRDTEAARIAMREHIIHASRLLAEHRDQPTAGEPEDINAQVTAN